MLEYILAGGKDADLDDFIPVGELARVAWGQATPSNKRKARARISYVFRLALELNRLLVKEFDGNRIAAVKIYDPTSTYERGLILAQITKLHARKELSDELYGLAERLITA
jgi:N6-adenosine-specific RNA methylase IME4